MLSNVCLIPYYLTSAPLDIIFRERYILLHDKFIFLEEGFILVQFVFNEPGLRHSMIYT